MSRKLQAERLQGLEGGKCRGYMRGYSPVTWRYSRNRIDAYDYVGASCFSSAERMAGAYPALYRVYGFISLRQSRTGIIPAVDLAQSILPAGIAVTAAPLSLPLYRSRIHQDGCSASSVYLTTLSELRQRAPFSFSLPREYSYASAPFYTRRIQMNS